jgi:predicted SAM-dependent methyltransferase
MKLHLGCGNKVIPGYVNIDIQANEGVECFDISNLPYVENSIDEIYSCANIEHFSRHDRQGLKMAKWDEVIDHWRKILKPGGILRLSTADFEAVCEVYMKNKNIQEILGLIVGGQKDPYDYHGMIFDFDFMKLKLEEIGFKDVKRYDWKNTEIAKLGIDDYSQAYLPHMDKKNGKLMMLNVEATKL